MSKNIREININQIKIHDPFWSAMQHRMTDTVIPFQEKVLMMKCQAWKKPCHRKLPYCRRLKRRRILRHGLSGQRRGKMVRGCRLFACGKAGQ